MMMMNTNECRKINYLVFVRALESAKPLTLLLDSRDDENLTVVFANDVFVREKRVRADHVWIYLHRIECNLD